MSAIAIRPINRAVRFYEAPIGKKAVMAVTGVVLFGYVVGHLLGNLQIYSADPEQINRYAGFLHNPANAAALWGIRAFLVACVVLHVTAAVQLWLQNRAARPVRYVKKDDVPAAYAARTMIWSGPIVGAFIVFHVLHLTAGGVVPLRDIGGNADTPDVRFNVIAGFHDHPGHRGVLHLRDGAAVPAPVPRRVEHVPVRGRQPSALHALAEEIRGPLRAGDCHRQHLDPHRRRGRLVDVLRRPAWNSTRNARAARSKRSGTGTASI